MDDRFSRVAVALVGCGRIARLFHGKILRDLPETELVAIADPDDRQRSHMQRIAPEADAVADYRDVLERRNVDAVVLCLPTGLHAQAAVAAFRAGKHVYLEKPLATSLDEGREVVSAWRESGRVGAIGFNTRLHPLYREARDVLAEGRVGKLVAARGVLSSAPRELPAWKQRRASGGGALLDLASHEIDRLEHLVGDRVDDVIATIRSTRTEDDTAVLTLRFRQGLVAQLLVTNSGAEEDRLEFHGQTGRLVIDRFRSRRVEVIPFERVWTRRDRLTAGLRLARSGAAHAMGVWFPRPESSFRESLRAFALAIRGSGHVAADILDGYRSLEVITAAEASAASGAPVRVTTSE